MKQQNITTIIHFLLIITIGLVAYLFLQSYSTYQHIQNITETRHVLIGLAQELQQNIQGTSNNARIYIRTANQEYKRAFENLLAERTGYMIRHNKRLAYPDQQFDLIQFIQQHPLEFVEKSYVQDMQILSDKLLQLETKAISMSTQKYKTIKNLSALRGIIDIASAQSILSGQEYLSYQENILQHINNFMQAVNTRITENIKIKEIRIQELNTLSIVALISILLIASWSMYRTHNDIPENSDCLVPFPHKYTPLMPPHLDKNTIMLHKTLNVMFQRISNQLNDIEQAVNDKQYSQRYTEKSHNSDVIESKLNFLASINHEFRTPINAILNIPQFLLETTLTDIQRGYVFKIISAGQALFMTLRNMLDYAEMMNATTPTKMQDFNFCEEIASINNIAIQWAKAKELDFSINLDPSIPCYLNGDPIRLRQILVNLLSNAVKFTSKGSITFSIKNIRLAGTSLTIGFRIKDTGIGITKEEQSHIFNIFTQSESYMIRNFGGTGLGLALSEKAAKLLGGYITVTSTPQIGSTFYLELPFEHSTIETPENTQHSKDNSHFKGVRCMLVEDNIIGQEIMQTVLESLGIFVVSCNNGQEALDLYKKDQNFDCIFMDIQMPTMDGYTATKHIRESNFSNSKDIPIFALTAHATPEDSQKSSDVGMNEHLTKPVEKYEIIMSLNKWCNKNRI